MHCAPVVPGAAFLTMCRLADGVNLLLLVRDDGTFYWLPDQLRDQARQKPGCQPHPSHWRTSRYLPRHSLAQSVGRS